MGELKKIVLASRTSELAMTQAEFISRLLASSSSSRRRDLRISIAGMMSRGDKLTDAPLAEIGGKEVFVKELQSALLRGDADFAVHSAKDLSAKSHPDFVIAATPARAIAADVFVFPQKNALAKRLADLPSGAIVGAGGPRRAALLRHFYPRLRAVAIRGNIKTRLAKLDGGACDGIILAAAGLHRLGLKNRIGEYLPRFIPAPGQGALAVECLANRDDLRDAAKAINNRAAAMRLKTERAFAAAIGGDCQTPLGAFAVFDKGELRLRAMLADDSGARLIRVCIRGADPGEVGERAAARIFALGGKELLS
jgi:hydroxymethylbilane synthase